MLSAPDEKVRKLGVRALGDISPDHLGELLRDPALSPAARAFLRTGGAFPPSPPSPLPSGPRPPGKTGGDGGQGGESSGEDAEDDRDLNTFQRIMRMNVGQKIKTAFKGDKEARPRLVRDSNREVYMAVLENPGMTESEIEAIAKNSGTNSDILRKISRNKEWMANHSILKGLVSNPKAPVEVATRFLPHLTDKELELLESSKNLPSALRLNAKRIIQARKKKGG